MRDTLLAAVFFVVALAAIVPPVAGQNVTAAANPLVRRYHEGERLSYRMEATNRDRTRTTAYHATARGVVKRDSSGRLFEEYEWTDMVWNGEPFALPAANREFRQVLSLSPDLTPSLPDFSRLHPRLIGPAADLMTFYSDVWLAMRQPGLRRTGDEVVVRHEKASSWADGTRVVLGEDAIDFVLTLGAVTESSGTIALTVEHLPPAEPSIRLPVQWMKAPVADTANNWVQVTKVNERRFLAAVGKETFRADIRLTRVTGKVASAHLVNPVEVLERECTDAALTECGEGVRYQILRQIEIREMP